MQNGSKYRTLFIFGQLCVCEHGSIVISQSIFIPLARFFSLDCWSHSMCNLPSSHLSKKCKSSFNQDLVNWLNTISPPSIVVLPKKIQEKFLSMTKICKAAANTEPFLFGLLFFRSIMCVSMAASLYPNQYLSHWHASLAWIAGHIQHLTVITQNFFSKNAKLLQ